MEPVTTTAIVLIGIVVIATACVRRIVVCESHVGLLYRNGRFKRELTPGRHFVWRPGTRCETFDQRRETTMIPGQELLSKDNVGLKITLAVSHEIADARLAAEAVQCSALELYTAGQLALREALAQRNIDEILEARSNIGAEMLPVVAEKAAAFGLIVRAVEIKDVMFPGELKRIFAEVVRAREEGRAALEKARGESAALRNLANAAKLLDGNPALMNLRMLQSIAVAAGNTGNTLVLGVPQGLAELPRRGDPRLSGRGATSDES